MNGRRISRLGGLVAVAALGVGLVACTSPEPDPPAPSSPTHSPSTLAPSTGTSTETNAPPSTAVEPTADPSASTTVTATPTDDRQQVVVQVSWVEWDREASAVQGSAVVLDVVEGDGSCTVTASRDGDEVFVVVAGEPDATSTICSGWALPDLGPGQWDVVVSYESPRASGVSSSVRVTVG